MRAQVASSEARGTAQEAPGTAQDAPGTPGRPPVGHGHTIPALVAAAARRFPAEPAVRDSSGATLTYAGLHDRATQAARFLAGLGLDRTRPVGMLVDHRIESVVAMLGILRAGHYYLPVDPRWPRARTEALLRRLGVACLFADETTWREAADLPWQVPGLRHLIRLDLPGPDWPQELEQAAVTALWDEVAASPDWAAAAGFGTFGAGPGGAATADAATGGTATNGTATTDELVRAYYRHLGQLLSPFLHPGARVLEIGCGTGEVAAVIAPQVAEYVGVDPSGTALRRFSQRCPTARGVAGFAHRLPEVGGDFDLAIFSSVVQFFPSIGYLAAALAQTARHLAGGGRIVLADLVDPGSEEHGGLRLPPRFFTEVVASLPGVASCAVLPRGPGETLPGRDRYDVVLTVAGSGTPLAGTQAQRWTGWHVARAATAALPEVTGGDLAYTIFTSGSTGTPKGVAVAHAEAARLLRWMNTAFGVGPGDTLLFVTAFSFDLSVYDVFGTLAAGACIRILSDRELGEPEPVASALTGEPVTIWDSAPAALQRVLPLVTPTAGGHSSLRLALLSGDWIPVPMPDRIRGLFPRARVAALGGATECTVWSNYYLVQEVDPRWPSIPYGRAMPHARYLVLDDQLRPCPPGDPGDLYIGGDCLAIGYLGDPARTAERFLPDPFPAVPGSRIYATGDRAVRLDDGNLRFLGRLDDQVKVRGYRIELGEVQSILAACPHVRDCAVIAAGAVMDRRVVGFYIPARPQVTAREVTAWLSGVLPPYMLPDDLVAVSRLPVSGNGKTDRAALAATYAAIGDGATRSGLARAWAQVIGREPGTIDEDFFEAGGDSLAAARLALLIQQETGASLDVAEVFATPTVQGLAGRVASARAAQSGSGAAS